MTENVPPRAPGPIDLRWDRQAKELQFTQLEVIRGVAEKWRAGLTALTGFLTAVVALAAPTATMAVRPRERWVIGVLLLLGLVCLAVATWRTMRAAFGIPEAIRNNGARLQLWSERATIQAATDLKAARQLAVGAFILFSCAGVVGYSANPGSPAFARVTTVDGKKYCGTLTTDEDGRVYRIAGTDATQHDIPLDQVDSVKLGVTC